MGIPPDHVWVKKGDGVKCKYCAAIRKSTGCNACDELPEKEICLKHQLEQADADLDRQMKLVEKHVHSYCSEVCPKK